MGCNCNCNCGNNASSGSKKTNAEAIIDLAVRIEKAGQKFYSTLAIFEYNDKIKDLLISLAEDESKHIEAFENLGKVLKNDLASDESGREDYFEYLDTIARAHMFFDMDIEDADYKVDTARETLELALKFERDSIMVFQEMKEVVGKIGKEVLDKLIDQERRHVLKLSHSFDKI